MYLDLNLHTDILYGTKQVYWKLVLKARSTPVGLPGLITTKALGIQ